MTVEAVSTSEMSAKFCYTKWRNIPEDRERHTRRRQELKSQIALKMENVKIAETLAVLPTTTWSHYQKRDRHLY
jgi:hypothetical protein